MSCNSEICQFSLLFIDKCTQWSSNIQNPTQFDIHKLFTEMLCCGEFDRIKILGEKIYTALLFWLDLIKKKGFFHIELENYDVDKGKIL